MEFQRAARGHLSHPSTTQGSYYLMQTYIPKGFQFAGVYCGIKRNPKSLDVSLIYSESEAVAAGVYTQNLVFAAPVALDRDRTPNAHSRLVVVNSGNANACTGDRGYRDAVKMTELASQAAGVEAAQVLVLSTGIIGEFLPMEKIATGITEAGQQLNGEDDSVVAAARGMMTTDTTHKVTSRSVETPDGNVSILGMAKGAAMIGPNMATMLGVVLTDAVLSTEQASKLLTQAVGDTFNCISVDGHMSTNDTVLMLANGASGVAISEGSDWDTFCKGVREVCRDLAKSIISDGEGATHLINIQVRGCRSRETAFQIAKTVAESPLVKTAVAGADPNWGRIVSAAGYAKVPFDPNKLTLNVNGYLLYENGSPVSFDASEVSTSIQNNRDTSIVLDFSQGDACIQFWSTDLTTEYVRLNADYHT